MVADLSVIIPVFRESAAIAGCLSHLAGCREMTRCEIIVVDGDAGSTRTPTEILPVTVIGSAPGRGTQLNAGARIARAPALIFLHVDTFPPPDFVPLVLAALEKFPAGAFDLSIATRNPIVALIGRVGRIRSRLTRVPYGDQAQFVRKSVFDEVGGFPDEPIMEDVALMDRLKAAGHRITILSPAARTSDRRWRAEGAIRGTLRNWRLIRDYRAGAAPSELVKRYPPRPADPVDRSTDRVLLFYRALRRGGVKTRLAADLGEQAALTLYEAMLTDAREALESMHELLLPFIDDPGAGVDVFDGGIRQTGESLEARMDAAFRYAFGHGARRAVLIGSDIPGLGSSLVRDALDALRVHDAVIGRTVNGGYYLIGFTRRRYRPILTSASLGNANRRKLPAEDPFRDVLSSLADSGMSVAQMPPMSDVDTAADLEAVYRSGTGTHPRLDAAVTSILPAILDSDEP